MKDLDFDHRAILVRDGRSGKDRVATMPEEIIVSLGQDLSARKAVHARDLARGVGSAWLPYSLERKHPDAATQWGWQFVFAGSRPDRDPRFGVVSRHHVHESDHGAQAR